jgi:hypothetical protein
MPPTVNGNNESTVNEQFETLARQWRTETALLSSSTALVNHPAYQAIIALGPPVIPLLLHDLEQEPIHWFEALEAITGENPVPREHWGHISEMRESWLAWG